LKSSNNLIVPDDLVLIGKIVGAHGIRGAVRVQVYAESVACFSLQSSLTLVDSAGHREPHEVDWVQAHKKVVRLGLKNKTTREQAEALVGCAVLIPKACLPPLEPDTYYWADLIGMAVYAIDGEYLGQVREIIATGANDVYVVKTPEGHPLEEILVPAIASVVVEIDTDQRRMRVDLPEGLM
jgi:16S rRNA processing protein RimM